MNLVSLHFRHGEDFLKNLEQFQSLVVQTPPNSIVLAPELALTGYITKELDLTDFNAKVFEALKTLSKNRTICLTLIIKEKEKQYNRFVAFLDGKQIYSQNKAKLFTMNKEHLFFQAGDLQEIKLFDAFGLKIGVLICFELRFTTLWEQLKGADVILIPAMWGKIRKQHLDILSNSLAIANQCFVIVSDSLNVEFTNINHIITPFGEKIENSHELNIQDVNLNEIQKMRRYLPVGI